MQLYLCAHDPLGASTARLLLYTDPSGTRPIPGLVQNLRTFFYLAPRVADDEVASSLLAALRTEPHLEERGICSAADAACFLAQHRGMNLRLAS